MTYIEDVVDRAKQLLGSNGENWFKGSYQWRANGKTVYCLVGAIDSVTYGALTERDDESSPVFKFVKELDRIAEEQFPDRLTSAIANYSSACSPITKVNDHPDTVFSEIITLVDKALIDFESEVTDGPA